MYHSCQQMAAHHSVELRCFINIHAPLYGRKSAGPALISVNCDAIRVHGWLLLGSRSKKRTTNGLQELDHARYKLIA